MNYHFFSFFFFSCSCPGTCFMTMSSLSSTDSLLAPQVLHFSSFIPDGANNTMILATSPEINIKSMLAWLYNYTTFILKLISRKGELRLCKKKKIDNNNNHAFKVAVEAGDRVLQYDVSRPPPFTAISPEKIIKKGIENKHKFHRRSRSWIAAVNKWKCK